MSGNIIWKLLLTAALLAWSLANILPTQDTPFETYLVDQVGADEAAFMALLEDAREQVAAGDEASVFTALRTLGETGEVDLARFFPDINLIDVKNVKRRNEIVLKELYDRSRGNVRLGLDLKGGVSVTFAIDDEDLRQKPDYVRDEELDKAVRIMRNRLDATGVAEPVIRVKGENALEVQLPGLSTKDNPEVIDQLKKPARLEFRLVNRDPSVVPPDMPVSEYPPGYEVLNLEREDPRTGEITEIPYFVKRIPEATGAIVEEANPVQNQSGGYEVAIDFTSEGSEVFYNITNGIRQQNRPEANDIGQLAIVLDGQLESAPTVNIALRNSASITGDFSQRQAIELSNVLNNPLDVPLRVTEMYEVGPSLAADARESSIKAAQLGAVLVVIFMIAFYWFGGVVAVLAGIINILIVLGVLSSLGATLTLPGVAALVLTLGMGVDANILIFERIREELREGKPTRQAMTGGFDKALSTIVDANVTTLITAFILIYFGTGPVKGFGVTLAIGICASMFCALIVTRFIFEFFVGKGLINRMLGFRGIRIEDVRFLNYRLPAFTLSWIIVAIGIVFAFIQRDQLLGIDFTGGDEVTVQFEQKIPTQEIRDYAAAEGLGEVTPVYQTDLDTGTEILKLQTEVDRGREILAELQTAFPAAQLTSDGSITSIGASVSAYIQRNAIISVLFALLGILLYVALRFEVGYGIGAVVATIHDVFMTIGIFVMLGGQFSAPMLAAILMIVGYSINDTIVVFDRIREELQLDPSAKLRSIVNLAICRVLSRSILTSITTLLAAVSLYIFGAGVITDFALVFIIGILTGTFSSIFIASPIFFWWHKGDRRHVEERELTPKYDWDSSTRESRGGATS